MKDIIIDTVADSIKLLPFLFLTYLLMEILEHKMGSQAGKRIKNAGKLGPLWGGIFGVVPQCGFSAAASSLYAGRVITIGTLMAVYLSTSDEMIPILLSNAVPFTTITRILAAKIVIACISGFLAEIVYTKILHRKEKEMDIHIICEEERCNCEDGILTSALKHTIKIFFYIFLLSFVLNALIGAVGEEALSGIFSSIPAAEVLTAALVGLIPNCASSVVITELYVDGMIGAGAMMSGLLLNAGVGILVLFRLNRDWKQNAGIIAALYGISITWGIFIEWAGMVF